MLTSNTENQTGSSPEDSMNNEANGCVNTVTKPVSGGEIAPACGVEDDER